MGVCTQNPHWLFWAQNERRKWDELCAEHIRRELSKPGAALTPLGPKPQMPINWDGKSFLRDLPVAQPPQTAIPDPAPVANLKRGRYHKLAPELKYQFFDTHRLLKHTTLRETAAWFNEHMPLVYCKAGNLTIDVVEKWKKKFHARPVPPPVDEAKEKLKPGPKKRELKLGEFVPWNNKRVSVAALTMLAAMLVAQVAAGVPLTTPIMLTSALAVFGE
jgi:hypothetical protein